MSFLIYRHLNNQAQVNDTTGETITTQQPNDNQTESSEGLSWWAWFLIGLLVLLLLPPLLFSITNSIEDQMKRPATEREYFEAQRLLYYIGGLRLYTAGLKEDEMKGKLLKDLEGELENNESELRRLEAKVEEIFMSGKDKQERTQALSQVYRNMIENNNEERFVEQMVEDMESEGEGLVDNIDDEIYSNLVETFGDRTKEFYDMLAYEASRRSEAFQTKKAVRSALYKTPDFIHMKLSQDYKALQYYIMAKQQELQEAETYREK